MPERTEHITLLLKDIDGGDTAARAKLVELVYDELRALAASYAAQQNPGHTLAPTALVHEAFLRLVGTSGPGWKDRSHFFAVAATAMRQILTDHARRKGADKRGGGEWQRISLSDANPAGPGEDADIAALDEALTRLAEADPRKHRVVELRFFGGLTVEEVAEELGVSVTTVESDWRAARAWLNSELSQ
jgi:RNA polymerase sigma-70 factor (ECF subfamily)